MAVDESDTIVVFTVGVAVMAVEITSD